MFCHQEWLNLPWNMGVSWVLQPTRTHSLNDENWISTGQILPGWTIYSSLGRLLLVSDGVAEAGNLPVVHPRCGNIGHLLRHIEGHTFAMSILPEQFYQIPIISIVWIPAGIPAQVAGEMQKSNWLGKGSDSHSERRYQEITSLQFPKQNISPTRDW